MKAAACKFDVVTEVKVSGQTALEASSSFQTFCRLGISWGGTWGLFILKHSKFWVMWLEG